MPGTVYLTFDDGPVPEATPWVLDELDRHNVKATFFMVGENVRKYPLIFQEVKRRGHGIGNHSMHHIRGFGINPADYIKDVREGEEITGSSLYRPAHGWLSPRQMRAVKKYFKVVMYDLVTRDYGRKTTATDVVANIEKYARDGSVIVFHDSIKSIEKLKVALPQCIGWLKNKGFEFEIIT